MQTKIDWIINTVTVYLDDGKQLELSYTEFEKLRELLNNIAEDIR